MAIQITVMSLDFDSAGKPLTKIYDKAEVTLGRDGNNDVVLARAEVSSRHAKLRVEEHENGKEPTVYLCDLGSSNGTMVENRSLRPEQEVEVLPNQRIIIGNYLIKTEVVKSEPLEGEEMEREDSSLFSAEDVEQAEQVEKSEEILEGEEEAAAGEDPYSGFVSSMLDSSPVEEPRAGDIEVSGASLLTVTVDGDSVVDLEIAAVQLFSLSGTATHKGVPLEGVEVDMGSQKLSTGSDGSFRFRDIRDGTSFDIKAKKKGYRFHCEGGRGEANSDRVISVIATKLFDVAGKVLHKGNPLSGVNIEDANGNSLVTDDNGAFVFSDLAEDTDYRLKAAKDQFVFESADSSGTVVDKNVGVTFVATQLFTLSGRVTNRGQALDGVEIDGGELGKTVTGPDGVWRFENVPEGKQYKITASKDGFVFGG